MRHRAAVDTVVVPRPCVLGFGLFWLCWAPCRWKTAAVLAVLALVLVIVGATFTPNPGQAVLKVVPAGKVVTMAAKGAKCESGTASPLKALNATHYEYRWGAKHASEIAGATPAVSHPAPLHCSLLRTRVCQQARRLGLGLGGGARDQSLAIKRFLRRFAELDFWFGASSLAAWGVLGLLHQPPPPP